MENWINNINNQDTIESSNINYNFESNENKEKIELNEEWINKKILENLDEAKDNILQAVSLERLINNNSEYFYSKFNWEINEKWYLFDKEWNETSLLPSQIDSHAGSNIDDIREVKEIFKGNQKHEIKDINAKILLEKWLNKFNEWKWYISQLVWLIRLKNKDTEYFNKNFNWKTDENWYLIDIEWKQTSYLPSQIDSYAWSNIDDEKNINTFIELFIKERI